MTRTPGCLRKKKTFPLNLRNVHFCLRQVTELTEEHLPESKVTLAAQSWIILCQCPFPHWVDSSWNHLQIMLIVHPHTYQIINIIFQSISKDNIESNVILVFHLMFCILFWEHGMGNQTVSDSAFCWMVWIQDGVFMWEGPMFAFIVAASKSSVHLCLSFVIMCIFRMQGLCGRSVSTFCPSRALLQTLALIYSHFFASGEVF